MPSNDWDTIEIGHLARHVTVGFVGSMSHYFAEEGIPLLRGQNIRPYRLECSNLKFIPETIHAKWSKSALQAGDVVLVRVGYPGIAAVIPHDLGPANAASLVIVRTDPAVLHPDYLAYVINSPWGQAAIAGRLVGSAQQVLNTGTVASLAVPVPPLNVQLKISAVLSAYTQLIEVNRTRIANLEEMARAVFRHTFTSIDSNPFSSSFGEIATEVREGVHPSDVPPTTPYVGLEHIPRKSLLLAEMGDLRSVTSRKWMFQAGDILFGKLRPYFHKVARAPVRGVCSTDAIVIRPKSGYEAAALLFASSDDFVAHATSTAGGTDRPRAKWRDLAAFPIELPSNDRLRAFEEAARPLVELMSTLIMQNANLQATRGLLLPRFISGEIDIADLDIDTAWLAA